MPAEMTYNSLVDTLVSYTERGDSTNDTQVIDQIPNFVGFTERRIARELKIQGFIKIYRSAFIATQPMYAKPDRWRETVSVSFGTGASNNTRKPLKQLSYESANAYWPDYSSTDEPRFWADADYNNFLVVPVPDAAYPYEIVIWELPALLDDENQTNWLSQEAPNALLHGSLAEMMNYLKNLEQAQVWQKEYDRDMAGLSGEDLQKIVDRFYKRQTS